MNYDHEGPKRTRVRAQPRLLPRTNDRDRTLSRTTSGLAFRAEDLRLVLDRRIRRVMRVALQGRVELTANYLQDLSSICFTGVLRSSSVDSSFRANWVGHQDSIPVIISRALMTRDAKVFALERYELRPLRFRVSPSLANNYRSGVNAFTLISHVDERVGQSRH